MGWIEPNVFSHETCGAIRSAIAPSKTAIELSCRHDQSARSADERSAIRHTRKEAPKPVIPARACADPLAIPAQRSCHHVFVMPGRGDEALLRADVPGIHVLLLFVASKNVDGRDVLARRRASTLIPGHDKWETSVPAKLYEFDILIIQLQLRSQKLRRRNTPKPVIRAAPADPLAKLAERNANTAASSSPAALLPLLPTMPDHPRTAERHAPAPCRPRRSACLPRTSLCDRPDGDRA